MANNYLSKLVVEYRSIGTLQIYQNNARIHSEHQIRQIASSIEASGFTNPVLIDTENTIIAGHGRVAAAKLLGIASVPTIRLEGLSDEEIRAYVIADNRIAERAGWDKSILAIELQHLLSVDINFDITLTGFEIPEMDLITAKKQNHRDNDDLFRAPETLQPVTNSGDAWSLGRHRILCGNPSLPSDFDCLMVKRHASLVFVDPAFVLPIDNRDSGNSSGRRQETSLTVGESAGLESVASLNISLSLLAQHSTSGSIHFVCTEWQQMSELLSAGIQIYGTPIDLCVWAKGKASRGSFYQSRHELIFVFKNGNGVNHNNLSLSPSRRRRSNIWEFPSVSTSSKRAHEGSLLTSHSSVKPVALIADAILDGSAKGKIVLDSFLGSGSTLIAAERVGRTCYGMEINPLQVDAAIRRWQRHTGDHAIHESSGSRFDEISVTKEKGHGQS